MILCIENPKVFQKTIRTNEFSKVAGYNINTQKYVAFLHTNNELSERKNQEKRISFKITSERTKYKEINLTKKLKYLYSENCKTLKKEIEDDTKKLKYISYSWIRRTNIF